MSFIPQPSPDSDAFGQVFRSSAIFYYRRAPGFRTTICVLDYWKLKRDIEVALVASVRDLDGRLLLREVIPRTVNYRPRIAAERFEGSVEIEAFAGRNLVIPYAAAMAIYEAPRSLCAVHSYSRVYSAHEIEEGRIVREGEEACWTVRDSSRIASFAVLHNGARTQPAQTARLTVRNAAGETTTIPIALPELCPYQTFVLRPMLAGFLAGRPGQAALSFRVQGAFTRLLVGNESRDGLEFQATHSNFNYSMHESASLAGDEWGAYLKVPAPAGLRSEVVIYPDCAPGVYELACDGRPVGIFRAGETRELAARELTLHARDGRLPCRIVTGLRLRKDDESLPVECSLGVVHRLTHPKRLFWGLCGGAEGSSLIVESLDFAAFGAPADRPIQVRLHGTGLPTTPERTFPGVAPLRDGLPLATIFPEAAESLRRDFCWYTVYSENRRLAVYTLWNHGERLAFEHAF